MREKIKNWLRPAYKYFVRLTRIKKLESIKNYYANNYSLQQSNDIVYNLFSDGKKHFIGRFGTTEIVTLYHQIIKRKYPWKRFPQSRRKLISTVSGMFSNSFHGLNVFLKENIKAVKNVDYLCIWENHDVTPYEQFFLKKYANKDLRCLNKDAAEAFRCINPWTLALKGKKVLVVNGNDKLISEQFANKDKLFGKGFWPEFELITYKPINTLAGNAKNPPYKTWKKCLRKMVDDISKICFDVALVSCGSYGMPLCSEIYKLNKTVMYVGGVLQFMFGIKGGRFEDVDNNYYSYINQYFKSPYEEDKPKDYQLVENGCYW